MKQKLPIRTQQGSALLEGLLAILIFSIGILGVIGLQATNLRQTTDTKYRLDASFLANQTVGGMWADRSNLANYEVTDEAVASLPNGKRTVAISGSQVTVTITWQMPGESTTHRHVTVTDIQ